MSASGTGHASCASILIPFVCMYSRTEEVDASEYWGGGSHSHVPSSSSRVQVMPAHGQEDEEIYLSNNITNTQVVLMDGQDALTLDQQADMMRANKGGCSSSCVGLSAGGGGGLGL